MDSAYPTDYIEWTGCKSCPCSYQAAVPGQVAELFDRARLFDEPPRIIRLGKVFAGAAGKYRGNKGEMPLVRAELIDSWFNCRSC